MRIFAVAAIASLVTAGAVPAHAADPDTLYQLSTLGALQQGLLQPAMSIGDLRKHGDFGLGTYEGLNGEMVVNNGTVYQVPFSGKAKVAKPGQQTPFAVVTFFQADKHYRIKKTVDLAGLGTALDKRIPTVNTFYAIKIAGTFASLETRSVPKQATPYPPLAAAVAKQRTFTFKDVTGTLVGIRSPQYVGSMNVPGYHWHFITKNGKCGGHVLSLSASDLRAAVDVTNNWHVELPHTKAFRQADLG